MCLRTFWAYLRRLFNMADVRNANLDTRHPIDKILATYEGSFALNAPAAGSTTTVTINIGTGVADTTFFIGVYSVDGGDTWNGFNTEINHVEALSPATNPQGSYRVYGESRASQFRVIGENNALLSATQFFNYTVLYKVALIAKPGQGEITLSSVGANTVFDSRLNYLKIAVDDSQSSTGVGQTKVFNHALGYVPRTRVFVENSSVMYSFGNWTTSGSVVAGTSDVTVSIGSVGTITVYARIYYDS